jgi:Holliday junction resolvase RusA-like endonuclease
VITFEVRGLPAPQGSKRPVRLGTGRIGMVESSKAVGPWREAVRAEAQNVIQVPFGGPVRVHLIFWLVRPKSHYRTGRNAHLLRDSAPVWPDGKPDVDKLARATMDGLTESGAWKDDAQVVLLTAAKRYRDMPGCEIRIDDMSDEMESV